MAELAMIASVGQAAAQLGGAMAGAAGQRVSGSLEKTRKLLEGQELRRKAVDVEAAADKKIGNMQEDAERVLSAQQAQAAASGFDAADTGITDLQGKVAAKAANAQIYERNQGITQAADLILGAGKAEQAGQAAKKAASLQSMGTIIGGVGSAVGTLAGGKSASGFADFLKGKQGPGGWRGDAPTPEVETTGTGGLYG
jgi:hypothetical protein